MLAFCCAGIDVTQDDGWEAVRAAVSTSRIDVLILNAGILIKDDFAGLAHQQDSLLEQVGASDHCSLCARCQCDSWSLHGCPAA